MFGLLLAASLVAPADLIYIEDVPTKGLVLHRRLCRAHIVTGKPTTVEVIHTIDQQFYSHIGGHRIVANRYLVTKYGGVFDLAAGRLVNPEQNGELVTAGTERAVYRVTNSYRDNGLFAFRFDSGTVARLTPTTVGRAGMPGLASPDGRRSAFFNGNYELWLYAGLPQAVADANHDRGSPPPGSRSLGDGFRYGLSRVAAGFMDGVPLLWLDDARLLSQTDNGRLVVIDADTGGRDPLPPILDARSAELLSPPRLTRDPNGRVVYACGHEYVIDVATRTATRLTFRAAGHGFEYDEGPDDRPFRYYGRDIGRAQFFYYSHCQTSPGHVAAADDRVRVWTVASGRWETLPLSDGAWKVNSVVGWVRR